MKLVRKKMKSVTKLSDALKIRIQCKVFHHPIPPKGTKILNSTKLSDAIKVNTLH